MKLIICCGMPRSGSTLQFNIVANVLADNRKFISLGWIDDVIEKKIDYSMDFALIKSHTLNHPLLNKLKNNSKVKSVIYLYTYRDIRDVIVSSLKKRRKKFNSIKIKNWIEALLADDQMIRELSCHNTRYEFLKDNIEVEAQNIAKLLGVDLTIEQRDQIKSDLSIDSIRIKMRSINAEFDNQLLIHKDHISDSFGEIDQWKSYLNPMQIGVIEKYSFTWLKENGYDVKHGFFNSICSIIILTIKDFIHMVLSSIYNWSKLLLRRLLPLNLIVRLKDAKGAYLNKVEDNLVLDRLQFYKNFLDPKDLVFDVGANFGNRVQVFTSIGCKVIAIEPQPECAAFLRYKFHERIVVEQICVGSREGESSLHISSAKNNVLSTLSEDFIKRTQASGRFSKKKWGKSLKVKVTTLDNLIKKHGIPKFIKIDTEGFEHEVIKGLSHGVKYISIEYTLPEYRVELLEILNYFNSNDMMINYSVGESMKFGLGEWISLKNFIVYLDTNSDSLGGFGDIYLSRIEILK